MVRGPSSGAGRSPIITGQGELRDEEADGHKPHARPRGSATRAGGRGLGSFRPPPEPGSLTEVLQVCSSRSPWKCQRCKFVSRSSGSPNQTRRGWGGRGIHGLPRQTRHTRKSENRWHRWKQQALMPAEGKQLVQTKPT